MDSYDPHTWVEALPESPGHATFTRRRRALCLASAALLLIGAAGAWATGGPAQTVAARAPAER